MDDNTDIANTSRNNVSQQDLVIRLVISGAAFVALILRCTYWHEFSFSRDELILLGVVILPWLYQFVKTFKVSKDGVEFTTQEFKEVKAIATAALDASLRGVKSARSVNMLTSDVNFAEEISTRGDENDPNKGLFGKRSEQNGRKLSAVVEKIPHEDFYRRVILTVESTDSTKPLAGLVKFHLHPTFDQPVFDEPVKNGVASTSIVSYGAFTIGAEADNNETMLELDLTSLNDGKDQFFNR